MTDTLRVFVAGHRGMVGAAILKCLASDSCIEIVTRTRAELDLLDQREVMSFFQREGIDQVYLAAAKVGGITANNKYPADFIYQNLLIECNVVHGAYSSNVSKLLFLGSSCIYPKLADQPMRESALLTGELEPTNEPYAIAKIAGIKLCESYNRQFGCDFRSVMPTNLYGPNDNFHPENSHVIPALVRRFHEAKVNCSSRVIVWGSGKAMREFLYVDDMAAACVHVMNLPKELYLSSTEPMLSHINVGSGVDCSIAELVETVARVVGYDGAIEYDKSKPDGAPRKLMCIDRLTSLGWEGTVSLGDGLRRTYGWFLEAENFRSV